MIKEQYIEHITEAEKNARDYGDQQILVAGDKDEVKKCSDDKEKVGNQSKEYYKE
jgi:hypothetical protein